ERCLQYLFNKDNDVDLFKEVIVHNFYTLFSYRYLLKLHKRSQLLLKISNTGGDNPWPRKNLI
ncbi:MAG: hypothetical protein ACP5KW_06250, partial [Thermoproteota archaeon]